MTRHIHQSHQDLGHSLRALSHDMGASFMLLRSSFAHLAKSLAGPRQDVRPNQQNAAETVEVRIAHVDACLSESQRLLDDLARLARKGAVAAESDSVELAAVVDEVLFEQRELLEQRGVEVSVQRPLPICRINRGRLKQVITNLIRNAILHGCDPQCPHICLSSPGPPAIAGGSRDRAMGTLRIYDNGPGLDPPLRDEIFLPGRRFAKPGVPSSGMGLAIVREIVEQYGGSVFVDPTCNPGTALVVRLPAAGRSAAERRPAGRPDWGAEHGGQSHRARGLRKGGPGRLRQGSSRRSKRRDP